MLYIPKIDNGLVQIQRWARGQMLYNSFGYSCNYKRNTIEIELNSKKIKLTLLPRGVFNHYGMTPAVSV